MQFARGGRTFPGRAKKSGEGREMLRSWKLGTVFGIGIYMHWTLLLLPIWVFFSNLREGPASLAVFAFLLSLSVFGCILLHELGHALAARFFGIPTRDITLYPIGGVARLDRMIERPWEEFWIALAGPAVNVAIALLIFPVLFLMRSAQAPFDSFQAIGVEMFLLYLMVANFVLLAGFNLLPAFPMDGGRVLRALLATKLGHLRATEIAASVGAGMCVLFVVAAVVKEMFMLIPLGLFVWIVGQQELVTVRRRYAAHEAEPLDVLPVDGDVIDVNGKPDQADYSGFTWDGNSRVWIEWRNGRPVHFIRTTDSD